MNNFKVGDRVVRKDGRDGSFQIVLGDGPYIVTAVSTKGYWLQVNGWDSSGKDKYPWYSPNFELVQMDDALPPAPESGLYFNHFGTRSASLKLEEESITLSTNASILKVRLTPETALDLAYDLRRMAMEIRRKGRNG